MTLNAVAFYPLAALIVATALAVVALPALLHAAYALAGCMAAVALLYLTIGADLVAAAQLILLAGAVPLLVIFAITLTRGGTDEANPLVRWWPVAAVASAGVLSLLLGVIAGSRGEWRSRDYPQSLLDDGTARTLGDALLTRYALPYEVAAVLLLAAVVGAVVLARRDIDEIALDEAEEQRLLREERVRRRREDREKARRRSGVPVLATTEEEL